MWCEFFKDTRQWKHLQEPALQQSPEACQREQLISIQIDKQLARKLEQLSMCTYRDSSLSILNSDGATVVSIQEHKVLNPVLFVSHSWMNGNKTNAFGYATYCFLFSKSKEEIVEEY